MQSGLSSRYGFICTRNHKHATASEHIWNMRPRASWSRRLAVDRRFAGKRLGHALISAAFNAGVLKTRILYLWRRVESNYRTSLKTRKLLKIRDAQPARNAETVVRMYMECTREPKRRECPGSILCAVSYAKAFKRLFLKRCLSEKG